jgi:alkanesulfonate monooxygenase SsuD/methylene tetrahydromethanopterin reductase-like flavin-dependent oxidoreductase (luciferase family)
MVAFPWRNPLELAQRFAAIAKLLPKGRHIAAGMGAGGAVQEQVMAEKTNPVAVIEETVRLMRGLLRGESVPLAEFPNLAGRFRYNMKTRAKLYFPPDEPVPVILAAGGPKTSRMAGRLADGIILTQIHPRTSAAGLALGLFDGAIADTDSGKKERGAEPFKTIYNLHLSVSADGRRARDWAKRNTSYGLATYLVMYPRWLQAADIDMKEVAFIREAYLEGKGVEAAAARVSDQMLEKAGFIFAGTPDDCLRQIQRVVADLSRHPFDQLVIGVPLGPDIPEALNLISREVLPPLLKMLGQAPARKG